MFEPRSLLDIIPSLPLFKAFNLQTKVYEHFAKEGDRNIEDSKCGKCESS
jgi:hypothetical protein